MAESAFKYCTIKSGKLRSIGNDSFEMDESNNARQSFPETYIPNGYVDIILPKFLYLIHYYMEIKFIHL